jgi:hypothetical protein
MDIFAFWRSIFAGGLVSTVLLGSLFTVVAPAQAYSPNPTDYWYRQGADTCSFIDQYDPYSQLYGGAEGGNCYINHTLGRKLFDPDSGTGTNLAVELWFGGSMVGQVFFEARGEVLTVADTANDDDALYVWVGTRGPYNAVGSSDPVDIDDFNLDLTDGNRYTIRITDDMAGDDVIASSATGLPDVIA